jgi:hypothetical protein
MKEYLAESFYIVPPCKRERYSHEKDILHFDRYGPFGIL